MKTLHKYLLRQITGSLLMTMVVFTFVLMIGSALREILPLLVGGQMSVFMFGKAIALLIPFVFAFALPMAMLTSTLLVFGRFSADSELTAARASGIGLVSLTMPILMLSLLLCGLSAWMNLEVAPRCRVAYNNLRSDLRASLANIKLPEGQYVDVPITNNLSYTMYARKNRNNILTDVLIYRIDDQTNVTSIHAPSGQFTTSNDGKIILNLTNVSSLRYDGYVSFGREATLVMDIKSEKSKGVGISDMTFEQLQQQLRDLQRLAVPPVVLKSSRDDEQARKREMQKMRSDFTEPVRVQLHKQMAFSFACFGFTLIGIPLGIRMHRRETNIGMAVALLLVAVYYVLTIIAESLSAHAEFAPHLLMWLPGFVFQAVGVVLLWRANRGI